MILLLELVWILPSLRSQRPRTVVTVGRNGCFTSGVVRNASSLR